MLKIDQNKYISAYESFSEELVQLKIKISTDILGNLFTENPIPTSSFPGETLKAIVEKNAKTFECKYLFM